MGLAAVLRDLGQLTRAAAVQGVTATAQIEPQDAVTFEFTVDVGGCYTLLVQHTGDDLTLSAKTPVGSDELNPGPTGRVQADFLTLQPGTYQIKAAADGGQGSFVDWELLMNNGVGQASATAAPVVITPVALPATTAGSAPDNAAATVVSDPSRRTGEPTTVAPPSSPVMAQGSSLMRFALGDLMGSDSLKTTTLAPIVAVHAEPTAAPAPQIFSEIQATIVIGLQPAVSLGTEPALTTAKPWWLDGMAQGLTRDLAVELVAQPTAGIDLATLPGEASSLVSAEVTRSWATIIPSLSLGAVAVAFAVRKRLRGHRNLTARITTDEPGASSEATVQRRRTIMSPH